MTALERVRAALVQVGRDPRGNGDKFTARCPAHDDTHASLSGSTGDDGRALLNCHAGCTVEAVTAALGLTKADLFVRRNGHGSEPKEKRGPIIKTYDYTDESGTVLYQVCRTTTKDFPVRRSDGKGGWIWGLGETRRVLYNLPQVIATIVDSGTVYVTEGEKDADAINALPDAGNVIATCNPIGAGKWRPEFSETLRGAPVVIVADKDEPGRTHARAVAASLDGIATSARIVEAKTGKDAADHLAAGHRLEDFVAVALPADPIEPTTPAKRILAAPLDIRDALSGEEEPIHWIVEPYIARGEMLLLAGESGLGKSFALMDLALALSTGGKFLSLIPVAGGPFRVLYLDLENPVRLAKRRLRRMIHALDINIDRAADMPLFYTRQPSLNLGDPEDQSMLFDAVENVRPDFVIIDSLVRCHRGDENSNSEMRDLFSTLQQLPVGYDCGVIVSHHLAKPTKERPADQTRYRIRGASDTLAAVDAAIGCQRASSGFVLIHEKSRWDVPAADLAVSIEDVDSGAGLRLVAVGKEQVVGDIIDGLLAEAGAAGVPRAAMVAELKASEMSHSSADRLVTRELARRRARGAIRKRGGRSAMTYFLTDQAPGDAE